MKVIFIFLAAIALGHAALDQLVDDSRVDEEPHRPSSFSAGNQPRPRNQHDIGTGSRIGSEIYVEGMEGPYGKSHVDDSTKGLDGFPRDTQYTSQPEIYADDYQQTRDAIRRQTAFIGNIPFVHTPFQQLENSGKQLHQGFFRFNIPLTRPETYPSSGVYIGYPTRFTFL